MINKMNIRSIFTDVDKIYSRVTIQNKGYQNRMRGDRNGHAYTYVELGPEGSVGNMRKCRWEKEKKRETGEREKHIGGPYQRGGAAKGDEGGGVRWET